MRPLVSIILPCYNAEKYLDYALGSIINQDYKNLEIICIDDGSSDGTLDILHAYQRKDDRIVIVQNEKNLGLIASLNKALSLVRGEYFARMDADDYSLPNRISSQINYISQHPEIDLVSTAYNYFQVNEKANKYIYPIATKQKSLKFLSLFCTPLTHASVLAKSKLIKDQIYFYDTSYNHAEDFELFSRLAWRDVKLEMISESFYWVRIHKDSVSAKFNSIQLNTNLKIIKRNLTIFLGINDHIDDVILKVLVNRIDVIICKDDVKKAFQLLSSFYKKADKELNFSKTDKKEIADYLLLHKLNIIIQANKVRFKALGFKNCLFSIRTFLMLNPKQYLLLLKKL